MRQRAFALYVRRPCRTLGERPTTSCRAAVLEIDGINPHIPQGKVVAGVADVRFQRIEIIVLLRMSEELILVQL